ncbi:hypothetical protein SVIOM342S_06936 [Streptomyces violaceorubidus]
MAAEQPTATVPGDQTRIHNIGYRSYDGPRLGRAYARRSLYSQSLRGAYGLGRSAKSKVLPMLLFVVMCLPAAIMVAVAVATKANDLPLDYTRYAIVLQAVFYLYVAAQAPQSVSRDLRFKTVPLYFSRPIETSDYVRAKYASLASALFILTAAPLLVLYVGALLAKLDFADQTKGFAQGTGSRGSALPALRRPRPGRGLGHPAPRLRYRGRHRRPDHHLRRGLHAPGHRGRPEQLRSRLLDRPVLADHPHRRGAVRLPGCHLGLPRRGRPEQR